MFLPVLMDGDKVLRLMNPRIENTWLVSWLNTLQSSSVGRLVIMTTHFNLCVISHCPPNNSCREIDGMITAELISVHVLLSPTSLLEQTNCWRVLGYWPCLQGFALFCFTKNNESHVALSPTSNTYRQDRNAFAAEKMSFATEIH